MAERFQAVLDDTRKHVHELIVAASSPASTPQRAEALAFRVLAGYVIGLRRLRYGRATLDEAVATVIEHTLD